jgi:hypothetical protein
VVPFGVYLPDYSMFFQNVNRVFQGTIFEPGQFWFCVLHAFGEKALFCAANEEEFLTHHMPFDSSCPPFLRIWNMGVFCLLIC